MKNHASRICSEKRLQDEQMKALTGDQGCSELCKVDQAGKMRVKKI